MAGVSLVLAILVFFYATSITDLSALIGKEGIYGGIMNPAAALMYNSQTINWEMLKAYYVSGLPMDLIHAATVIFILIAAEPMLEKLDRIKVKYGLVEQKRIGITSHPFLCLVCV